jgi:beta-exotoxin I transport system ATP-binding protein
VDAPAIRLEHLGKRYGAVPALRDVSLEVVPGEIFGFLGLNGAGKTTTIRILLDLVRPTSGRASIFGADCQARGLAVRAQLGYLPGEPGFYGDMTGAATLDLLGRLSASRVDEGWRKQLLDRLEFAAADLKRPMREYSTGMKRKLGIVQAFQTDPPLLVLDEPTEGLDPLMQDAFYELVAETRRRERTIFMSSHVLPEVERVCDRIGLLRGGELVLLSAVEDVRRLAGRRVRVTFGADVPAPRAWPDGFDIADIGPRQWDVRVHGAIGPLVALVAAHPVVDLDVQVPHLEEVLKKYYARPPAP